MTDRMEFAAAPWNKTVKTILIIAPIIITVCTAIAFFAFISLGILEATLAALITFVILLPGCNCLTIKGYILQSNELLTRHLFWCNSFALSDNAKAYKAAFKGTRRLFAICGWSKNDELTNPDYMVIVEDGKRKLALSPYDPDQFIEIFNGRAS